VAIDLDRPEGIELAKRLVRDADVVVENYSPRVVESFGLGYDAVSALNPAAIMIRMPGFGLSGVCRDWVGWALTFEQLAGCAFVTGAPGGRMFAPGGFADPVVGMHAAVALQAALAERETSGKGQLIEIAQIEVIASLTAEQVIRHSIAGELMTRTGNREADAAPQGIYRCAGDDEWIALSVRNDDDWSALCGVLGNPEWAGDEKLRSLSGRRTQHDAIDSNLGAWTASRDARTAAEQLLAAGVPAAALLKTGAIYGEPQLQARGYFQTLEHPVTGPLRYPAWPMHFSFLTTPSHPFAAGAPTLGQHNEEILGGVLGLSREEIDRLRAAGVIGEMLG
jgi:crotonobetainyl-CoA:carnitine CoA-transferase CaiB-like acyl-CoA transferase